MVAAFHFIPRIVPFAVIAVVDAADDAQPFADHAFMEQVGSELIFAAGPDFVAIKHRLLHTAAFGPGADEESRLAGPGEPALRRIGLVLGGYVRRPVVFVDRLQSGADLVARINISQ